MASCATAAVAKASHEHAALPALLLIRRIDAGIKSALRERFCVLDFFASAEPLPAFLAAAALPDPHLAAGVMGGSTFRVDDALLDVLLSLRCIIDHIDLHTCARRHAAASPTPGGSTPSTSPTRP
jgi:glyoxylate/hydroxypyruvate reductase